MEDLAERLVGDARALTCISRHHASIIRGPELLWTTIARRSKYDVAVLDVYSGRTFMWSEIAAAALRAARRPFVLVLRGGGLPGFAARHPARVRRCLGLATVVAAPSRFLLERMHAYRRDMQLLPNPVDLERCTFRARTSARPALVWLRAFRQFYNPSMAPAVVAELRTDVPDVQLIMIGPDAGDGSWTDTERTARDRGVADRVAMPGGVPKRDVPAWLQRGDIFLNTTNADNTPVSVLEAMACGLCVVSTDVGGIPYLIEHEKEGLLVPPRDPTAMAAAVRRLLREPALAAHLSHHARKKAEQFGWPDILSAWRGLMRMAVA